MSISDANYVVSLNANAVGTRTHSNIGGTLGSLRQTIQLPDVDLFSSLRARLGVSGDSFELDLSDNSVSTNFSTFPTANQPSGSLPQYLVVDGDWAYDSSAIGREILPFFSESAGLLVYSKAGYSLGGATIGLYYFVASGSATLSLEESTLSNWESGNNAIPFDAEAFGTFVPSEGLATGNANIVALQFESSIVDDGVNFEGRNLAENEAIYAILVKCLSGSAKVEIDSNEIKDIKANGVILLANSSGITDLQTKILEITATSHNTELVIDVAAEQTTN